MTSLLGVLGCIASAIVVGSRIYNQTSKWGDENVAKTMVSVQKIVIPIAIVGTILGTFIPSESTITKMLIAQNVTYERVEMATDTVQSVYEDIMGLFEEDYNGYAYVEADNAAEAEESYFCGVNDFEEKSIDLVVEVGESWEV